MWTDAGIASCSLVALVRRVKARRLQLPWRLGLPHPLHNTGNPPNHPCCTHRHCTAGCLPAGQHQWAGVAWCSVLHYSTSEPSCVCVCRCVCVCVCSAALYTGSAYARLQLARTAGECVCAFAGCYRGQFLCPGPLLKQDWWQGGLMLLVP